MTRDNNNKLRAIFLASLMFFWLFAGTVAFAGGAAAAANTTFDTLDPDTVDSGETVVHDYEVSSQDIVSDGDTSTFTVTLPDSASFDTDGTNTVNIDAPGAGDAPTVDDVSFADAGDGTNNQLIVQFSSDDSDGFDATFSGQVTVEFPEVSQDTSVDVTAEVESGGTGDNSSDTAQVTILNTENVDRADSDGNLTSGGEAWFGQNLYFEDTSADAGDRYRIILETDEADGVTEPVGTFRVDTDGQAVLETPLFLTQDQLTASIAIQPVGEDEFLEIGQDGVTDGTTTTFGAAQTDIIKQNINLKFRDADNDQTNTLVQGEGEARITSNRGDGYRALITVDDTANVTDADLEAAFSAFGATDRRPNAAGSGVVINVPQQAAQRSLDSAALPAQDIEFTISVTDAVAEDTESLTVQESVEVGVVDTGASFEQTVLGDDAGQQVGDLVEIEIDFDDDHLEDDQRARTLITLGNLDTGFIDALIVTDEDGDGSATIRVNTYMLGTTETGEAVETGLGTLYPHLDTEASYFVSGASVAGAPGEGDPADEVVALRVGDDYEGLEDFPSPGLEVDGLENPIDEGSYTVQAHNVSDLGAEELPITTRQTQEDGAVVTRLNFPVESDAAELTLEERNVGDANTWIAPSADFSEIDSTADVLEGVTGNVSDSPTITESDEVAQQDTLIIEIESEGLAGQIREADRQFDDEIVAFLGLDGVHLYIEEQTAPQNRDPAYLDLRGDGVKLINDGDNDTYYVVVDTDRVETVNDERVRTGEYEAELVQTGGVFADFIDEGDFPEFDDVDSSLLFPASPVFGGGEGALAAIVNQFDPYQSQAEQQSTNVTYNVVDRQARFDRVGPDGNLRLVAYEPGTSVTGTTTVAPGTDVLVRMNIDDPEVGLIRNTVTVDEERTFSTEVQLGGVETDPATEFQATVQERGQSIVADAQAGVGGTVPGLITGASTVTMADQETRGDRLVVDEVFLPQGGFIAIHAGDASGEVVGTSQYLPPGTYESVGVQLDSGIESSGTFVAMPHQDTNENQLYEFPEADGPYLEIDRETVVISSAEASLIGEDTPTPDPDTPTPEPTDTPTPDPDTPTPEPTDTPDDQTGFGAVIALIALLGAALLAARRNVFDN